MDPINRGPEEYGQDSDHHGEGAGQQRPSRDPLTPDFGQPGPAPARTVQLISGDFLLTVNPVDGSEIEPCPPGEQPARPVRHSAEDRAELDRAAGPALPPGPPAPPLPLLERQEERERLVRLLSRGRSVRLTGPAGSGRTSLLDAVAADCADLAPDGVVRLSGHRRTPTELLYELGAAVFDAPRQRLDRTGLLELVRDIGAVVVLDDLEFGGDALEELLDATPECAFLLAATPDAPPPHADSHLEEVFLGSLGRSASLELLERAVDRPLTDEEANWAGDLWFESEGLPLRFVQAGALLRQRDALRAGPDGDPYGDPHGDQYGSASDLVDEVFSAFGHGGRDEPLPTLGEGAAPAPLLAARLSEAARDTLRFAVALGGEVPHQAHLPALIGDTHADAALGELLACGLLSPAGPRYRLAAGAVEQLAAAGYGEGATERAHTAAQHYAWWAGHPSVTPERAAAEADAVLAALAVSARSQEAGHASSAVLLARSAAPAFAAGLHWGAWERALRGGQEAARVAGEVAEEAYFHHELGILALCSGQLDRARAELETSIGMRGVLADKRGTVAGRRALALVADRSGGLVVGGRTPAGEEVPAARYEESASPPGGVPAVTPFTLPEPPDEVVTVMTPQVAPAKKRGARLAGRLGVLGGARRNLVAAGAGALLAAVLGTVVTIGATSGGEEPPTDKVKTGQSVGEDDGSGGMDADEPTQDSTNRPGGGGDGGTGGSTGGGTGPGPSSDAAAAGGGSATGGTTTGGPSTPGATGGTDSSGSSTTGGTGTGGSPSTGGTGSGGTPTTGGTGSGGSPTTGGGTGSPTTGGGTGSPTTGGGTGSPSTGGTGEPTTGGGTGEPTTGGGTGSPTTGGGTGEPTTGGGTGEPTTGGGTGEPTTGGGTTGPSAQGGTSASPTSAGGTTTGPSSPGSSSPGSGGPASPSASA